MNGLRPRLAASARVLLDIASVGFIVVLWVSEAATPWLQLAYLAVVTRTFLRAGVRSTFLRVTLVTIAGGGILIHLHLAGDVPSADVLRVPLLALLGYFFAGFSVWRSRAEDIARDHDRLSKLIDALPLATIALDANADVVSWNTNAEKLFGWSAAEVLGRQNPIVPPEEESASYDLHERVLEGETLRGVELVRQAADGTLLELGVHSSPIDAAAGPRGGFLVMYDDIRDRKRAERDRDDAQGRYRDLIEALPLVTYIDRVDDQATNIYTSPQIAQLLGWEFVDWISDPGLFEELLHPDDLERVMVAIAHSNATRRLFDEEYRLRHRSGEYVWVHDQSTIIDNGRDEPVARGFLLDISKQKRLEEQLLQAQKMDALGQFAGGIAHDFNNLLTAISGYAELASGSVLADAALMRCLDGIAAASAEAANLTSRLLSFSRRNVLERHLVDLNDVARGAAGLLERLVRSDVIVRLELAEGLPPVSADLSQLKQVVLNLALNARDAMVEGGVLTIETSAAGDSVALSVRDTGCGMSEQTRSRAFEPFFTTKAEGEGTGLGLAVAYGVIDSLGGTLSIHSAPGAGTTVEALLPAAAGEPTPHVPGMVPPIAHAARAERVLVVEDREVVRNLAIDVLEAAGFEVAGAAGGHEALAIVESARRFDLLLTDVVMPVMSGPQLSKQLRKRFPGLPVLYMSGYTDDVLDASAVDEPATAFLRKPFANASLVARVRALLDDVALLAGASADERGREPVA